jgi:hypothetical protein
MRSALSSGGALRLAGALGLCVLAGEPERVNGFETGVGRI